MTAWTEQSLGMLERTALIRAAAELGLIVYGKPDSTIIYEILVRQGELAGRAATPLEVRMLVMEKSIAKIEGIIVEIAAAFGETTRYLTLPGWVRDLGTRFRARYILKPSVALNRTIARERNIRERYAKQKAARAGGSGGDGEGTDLRSGDGNDSEATEDRS